MKVDTPEGAVPAPDELDAVKANETPEPENEQADDVDAEAESEAEGDEPDTSGQATDKEAGEDDGAEQPAAKPDDEGDETEAEAKETKSQRKRRLRREREEQLRLEADRLRKEKEALEKRLEALGETDPNAADDYDAAVAQNAVNRALKQADTPRLEALKAEIERAEQETQQARAEAWTEKVSELTHIKDFAQKVYDPTLPFSNDIVQALQEVDRGPEVAYHLANNREELIRLQMMTPVQMGAALARIEAGLTIPKPKTKSTAPKPLKTLKGSSTESEPNLETADYDTYKKVRGLA